MDDKKRRGRKPKSLDKDEVTTSTSEQAEQTTDATIDIIDKKKRGRKPKSVYNTLESPNATIVNTSISDDENIIVRLHVNDTEDDIEGDPKAYNRDTMEYHMASLDTQETSLEEDIVSGGQHKKQTTCELKVVHVLKDFEEKNKNNEWPSNTSIYCYWCCHRFDNAPFGIPVNYNNNKFNVYGCFCSLECAASYNFRSSESLDEIWERYNLINLLARKIGYGQNVNEQPFTNVVKPAPERLTLKVFGGFLDIDAFRTYNNTQKVVNINFPPMTSLTQQIEEINEYELNSEMKYIPLDMDRINKCKEKMMFKRSKPVYNERSTLESSMNLKIC